VAQTDIFSVQFLHGSAVHVPLQQQTGREGVTKESGQGPVMARCEMLNHQPNAKNVILNTQRHPELVSGSVRGQEQERLSVRC
jgi:hypothetical protein